MNGIGKGLCMAVLSGCLAVVASCGGVDYANGVHRSGSTPHSAAELPEPAVERVVVAADGRGFVLEPSGRPFHPWGLNYGNHGRLIEDYWGTEWDTVAGDFQEMKALGANVVRVHLQFGKFMTTADRPTTESLRRLRKLVALAEKTGLYLDLTGLGCYRTADVPPWYDTLDEAERWAAQGRFWEAVASTGAGHPAVFCYDLMNEPVSPGGRRNPGAWYSGQPFGDYDFIQWIALDPRGRARDEIARQWIETMTQAIRKQDRRTLVTVGLLPWTPEMGHMSGFVPKTIAPALDFISVHIYPESGKVGAAMKGLKKFAVGKPVVIEETFPLRCGREDLETFLRQSRTVACGWMGHYDGQTPEELLALQNAHTITIAQSMWLSWLETFQGMKGEMVGK